MVPRSSTARFSGDQGGAGFALGDRRQEAGLHAGRGIHAGGNAIGEQIEQELFLTRRRVREQLDEGGDLLGVEGQRDDAFGGAFFHVLSIFFEHDEAPSDSESTP